MTEKKDIAFFRTWSIVMGVVLTLIMAFSGSLVNGKWNGTVGGVPLTFDRRDLSPEENSIASLTGIDDFGRKVTVRDPSGSDELYLGVFYFAWLGNQNMTGIYDINELEKIEPFPFLENCPQSPKHQFHFTSEPLYGYYSMNDPWIITRHIELLTMAGVDYVVFDLTNRVTYDNVLKLYLTIGQKFLDQGWNVPRVSFYTNTDSGNVVNYLYENYYLSGEYDDMWFRFHDDDRPVIIGISSRNYSSDQVSSSSYIDQDSDIYKYYNWYESQWPFCSSDMEHGFPWIQWGPPFAFENGNASVSVAQHSWESVYFSDCLPTSSRGFDGESVHEDWMRGQNFQYHWDGVFKSKFGGQIRNVFITGFNEWTAIKYPGSEKGFYMVDDYNAEYSRDFEMGKVYGDSFYMQVVENGREYQMKDPFKYIKTMHTILNLKDLKKWDEVDCEYKDFEGDALARDGENAANVPHSYVDNSNRNDIVSIKVTHDLFNFYFMVKTADDITAPNENETNWMNIFISGGYTSDSFAGFNYVINRHPGENGKTSVEVIKSGKNYEWRKSGTANYYVEGNTMVVKVPKAALGLSIFDTSISFKVTDNVTNEGDILDYYITGDSAPMGRFGFAY